VLLELDGWNSNMWVEMETKWLIGYIARYVEHAIQNKVVVMCWNKSQTFLYIYPNGK